MVERGRNDMNENMKSGGYEVRKVKSFRGMEGFGFNAELVRDGKPVALVIDEGNGGCYMFEWYDRSAALVPVKGFNVIGEAFEFNGSPEEAKLQDYLNGLPWTENEWDKKKYPVSNNGFVGSLVDDSRTPRSSSGCARTRPCSASRATSRASTGSSSSSTGRR